MFEHRRDPLAPPRMFARRVARHGAISGGIVLGSLSIGAVGYHGYGALPWIDALLNAAMILTGMGPVDAMRTTGGKLFATGYALFSGVAFLTIVAVLLAPVFHRFLHRFHLELADEPEDRTRPR